MMKAEGQQKSKGEKSSLDKHLQGNWNPVKDKRNFTANANMACQNKQNEKVDTATSNKFATLVNLEDEQDNKEAQKQKVDNAEKENARSRELDNQGVKANNKEQSVDTRVSEQYMEEEKANENKQVMKIHNDDIGDDDEVTNTCNASQTAKVKKERRNGKQTRDKSVPPKETGGVLTRKASVKSSVQ
ncbi:hypothetical protein K7X08_006569 [Anisodus acutangulus]|uniref:Uncharacterized protein n=1 Tax=Anisodus acutangulus TaxID=402998 RepID=A0A9Q1MW18_9SOLA|nr:hypothetical protein K7X08_006569 [Anisodus acutangulus]